MDLIPKHVKVCYANIITEDSLENYLTSERRNKSNMNKVWTRYEGLILTDWEFNQKIPTDNRLLLHSLIHSIRTGESILYNDKPCIVNPQLSI